MSFPIGKKIADNLREYPLPKIQGTRDYIFFVVAATDGYGKGARYFFSKMDYKNHQKKDVATLEAIITHLHAEVKSGVSHIREVIIVSHGNSQGLIFPVMNGATDTNLKEYKYLTAASLVLLQKDFLDGKFAEFNKKRKEVIAKMSVDSWITLRACNFGQSKAGMYAFYAFFGGRANLYAPKVFQFYGSHPLMSGMRLETKLDVHEHLVRQRFLPKDMHTPDRKDAIVKAIIDPANFSEQIKIATITLGDTTSAQAIEYEGIVDALNSRNIPEVVKSKILQSEMPLSAKPRAGVISKDSRWLIKDKIQHNNEDFVIEYDVYEEVSLVENTGTIFVQGSIPKVYSAHEFFPIQLFFGDHEDKEWKGRLSPLASYIEAANANPVEEQNFKAVLDLLDKGKFTEGAVNIFTLFDQQDIKLNSNAKIVLKSTVGTGVFQRKTWVIEDTPSYLVKLEHPPTSENITSHVLMVYTNPDKQTRLREEYELMKTLGTNQDIPGTELPVYLDQYTLDELAEFVDFLRKFYKPENVVYIKHALEALGRKKGFEQWLEARPEEIAAKANQAPLYFSPYRELLFNERDDYKNTAYEFETNLFWKEVKASSPPEQPFNSDLFTEQVFKFKTEDLAVADNPESDSPFTDIEELREIQRKGIEKFFGEEKYTVDPKDDDNLDCEEFGELLEKLHSMDGKSSEEMEELMKSIKIKDKTVFDILLKGGMTLLKVLNFINIMQGSGGLAEKIAEIAIRRFPSIGVPRVLGPARLITFTRALGYIGLATMVIEMFVNFIQTHDHTIKVWTRTGTLTAVRQYLRRLEALTFAKAGLPDTIVIDLVAYHAELKADNPLVPYLQDQYAVSLYFKEQVDEWGSYGPHIFAPDKMKEGFDEGVKLIEKEVQEVYGKADQFIDDYLMKEGLDACKIGKLRASPLFDLKKAKAMLMRDYAGEMLSKLPHV